MFHADSQTYVRDLNAANLTVINVQEKCFMCPFRPEQLNCWVVHTGVLGVFHPLPLLQMSGIAHVLMMKYVHKAVEANKGVVGQKCHLYSIYLSAKPEGRVKNSHEEDLGDFRQLNRNGFSLILVCML